MAYRRLFGLLGSLLLAGCASMSPAERAARADAEAQQMMMIYGPACSRLGYKRDDDKWRDCVLSMAIKDDNRALRYNYPMNTTCFGSRGFLDCTTF